MLFIKSWQSKRGNQKQNFGEQRWGHHKINTNWVMIVRHIPPQFWFHCADWVADVMNHTAEKSLGWKPPLEILTGQTVDISKLLYFVFYDKVAVPRFKDNEYQQQLGSKKEAEITGRFIGFSWNVGHAMMFKIYTDDTKKIICQSRIWLLDDPENHIKPEKNIKTTTERQFLQSVADDGSGNWTLPTIDALKCPFVDLDDEGDDEATDTIPVSTPNDSKGNGQSNNAGSPGHTVPPQDRGASTESAKPRQDRGAPRVETVDDDTRPAHTTGDPSLRRKGSSWMK